MTDTSRYNEKELFLRIADGDEWAFRQLLHLYGPQVKPVIQEIIGDPESVKDLIQDIFLHLWISREKLSDVEIPRSWIFRIVYYQSYAWLRQQGVRDRASKVIYINQQKSLDYLSGEDHASFQQTSRLVQDAVHQLAPQSRRIYTMSREEGLSIQEIAQKLNIAPQTVKNTLNRATRDIRTFLVEKGVWVPVVLLLGHL